MIFKFMQIHGSLRLTKSTIYTCKAPNFVAANEKLRAEYDYFAVHSNNICLDAVEEVMLVGCYNRFCGIEEEVAEWVMTVRPD